MFLAIIDLTCAECEWSVIMIISYVVINLLKCLPMSMLFFRRVESGDCCWSVIYVVFLSISPFPLNNTYRDFHTKTCTHICNVVSFSCFRPVFPRIAIAPPPSMRSAGFCYMAHRQQWMTHRLSFPCCRQMGPQLGNSYMARRDPS